MSKPLYSQPTAAPSRKTQAGGLGAILATMIAGSLDATGVPYFERLFAYPGMETALGGGITLLFVYFAREYAPGKLL